MQYLVSLQSESQEREDTDTDSEGRGEGVKTAVDTSKHPLSEIEEN